MFNWFLRQQKSGDLLIMYRDQIKSAKRKQELESFLENHPSLSWINDVNSERFESASETLNILSKEEVEFLSRKKVTSSNNLTSANLTVVIIIKCRMK